MDINKFNRGLGMPLTVTIIAVALVFPVIVLVVINRGDTSGVQEQDKPFVWPEDTDQVKQVEDTNTDKEKMSDGMDNIEVMGEESAMAVTEKKASYDGTVLAGKEAPLLDFKQSDYEKAIQSDKLVVFYFFANWCPSCKAEFPKMQSAFEELTTDNVIGFRVNYNDDETDDFEVQLARDFGVAYRHTKVFMKNGKRILNAPDQWEKVRYISEINKALGI